MHEDWCWKNKSLEVEVLEDDVSAIEFRQTGYMLRCSLSHAITLVCMASEDPLIWKGISFGEQEGLVCQDYNHSVVSFPFLPFDSAT